MKIPIVEKMIDQIDQFNKIKGTKMTTEKMKALEEEWSEVSKDLSEGEYMDESSSLEGLLESAIENIFSLLEEIKILHKIL